jgi:cell division GTPase FtsZ
MSSGFISEKGKTKMSAQTTRLNLVGETIVDDITNEQPTMDIDQEKLAKLKAKLAEKTKDIDIVKQEEPMSVKPVKKERSINFGVIGSGQAGSKLAQQFRTYGYDCVAINTAQNDLKFIDIPESNKLLLEYSLGGAAKTLEIGKNAAEVNRDAIKDLVSRQLADAQIFILCSSLGGGSGAGSCEVLVDILTELGKPIVIIGILPMHTEDLKSKSNSMEVLSKLSKELQTKKVANIILVDNARIESIYHNIGQMDFFNVANKAIVEPIDIFNTLSSMPSSVKAIDSVEYLKILLDGEGFSTYGSMVVENYTDETSIAEAIISNMNNNLLASGFNIKESKYVGFIVSANKTVWKDIPAVAINYANALLTEQCGTPDAIYRGIYETDDPENIVRVYSFFSGLGIPQERTNQLTEEIKSLSAVVADKGAARNLNVALHSGKNTTISDVQKIKDKVAGKSSTFGKFVSSTVTDRRK